jgi:hypothetical protein
MGPEGLSAVEGIASNEFAGSGERLVMRNARLSGGFCTNSEPMGAFVCRVLCTVGGLVLLLPPGWCNFVCQPAILGQVEGAKKTHGGCCDLCQCKDREKPPPEPNHPSLPCRCCCFECDWLKPNPPEKPVIDSSLSAFVLPQDAGSTRAVPHDLDLSLPGPSPPLHLLKCVWLC